MVRRRKPYRKGPVHPSSDLAALGHLLPQGEKAATLAHFTDNRPLNDAGTLIAAAEDAGLDGAEARAVLTENRYAEAVRAEERLWLGRGITGVPAVVVENKWLISGGQPPEVFEQALRRMAEEGATIAVVSPLR